MKISVTVKAGSKVEEVSASEGEMKVKVKESAKEGKANKAVIRLLAAYYKVPKSTIKIVAGASSSRTAGHRTTASTSPKSPTKEGYANR